MKYKIVLFFIVISTNLNAQDNTYKCVKYLKAYQLDSISNVLSITPNSFSKQFFKKEYDYLKNGINKKIELFSLKNDIDSILYFYHLGNYYSRKKYTNDNLSFKNFKYSLVLAKNKKDTLLINLPLLKINEYHLRNYKDKRLYKKYVQELDKYKKDDIDKFWATYYNNVFDMTFSSFTEDEFIKLEKQYLNLLKKTPKNPYFKATLKNMISIFYTYVNNKNDLVRKYCEEAVLVSNEDEYYSLLRKKKASINVVICDFEDKNYQKIIDNLKNLLENKFIKKDISIKYHIYDWIYKSYKKLKKSDSSQYYLELKTLVNDSIKQYEFAEKIRDIDVKHEVEKTNKQLEKQRKQTNTLKTKMNTILPILVIIIFLLGIVFILYKKYYKKTEILEEEKSETIKKIDELKQIVIKNHIILKDKTKVYIADLLYIKSDDHYLKIFLSNGKNHFVRGRLNKIIEELPPNFIRCHRSYVVNRNFIKQINNTNIILVDKTEIPLSRSFKDKL